MLDLFLVIILTTLGQILLSDQNLLGLILYALAIPMLVITLRQHKTRPKLTSRPSATRLHDPNKFTATQQRLYHHRFQPLLLLPFALASAVVAFLAASENTYRWFGVVAWLLAIGLFLFLFWEREPDRSIWKKLNTSRDGLRLSWATLALIGLLVLGIWFRFWRLGEMPSEMTSDHVEKLLDVHDLVTGQRPIFFVRNTGREPWQFYWTLMFIRLFELDTKFFALKLGAAAVGMLMLPGVYLLGRDLFNRWIGLWATLFAAVASWPVILSRVGLRFPFAPAATVWSLLYLLRGLRDGRRNDFVLLGLWLGIGLHGYTAFRAMPLAVVVCWALVLAIRPLSLSIRPAALIRYALLTVLIAGVVFIPLGRFSLEHPEDFWGRSASRMADPNQPMPDGPVLTFLKNLVNLALMFHWQGDDVWVNTLSFAPVLDPLLGGLLVLGLVIAVWHSVRMRDPIPLLLLVAGVILLLPSALSLAYAIENPSVVRTGGAIPVVMVVASLPLSLLLERNSTDQQPKQRQKRAGHGGVFGIIAQNRRSLPLILGTLVLVVAVTVINYRRYFVDYWAQYQVNALNTTEIASAIHGFVESGGDLTNAWIIAWPYWIDTRGVGIELGDPTWNNVILDPEDLAEHINPLPKGLSHASAGRPRLYVLHPEDKRTLERLRSLFPRGWPSVYVSEHPERSFVRFYVPRLPSQVTLPDWKGMAAYAR